VPHSLRQVVLNDQEPALFVINRGQGASEHRRRVPSSYDHFQPHDPFSLVIGLQDHRFSPCLSLRIVVYLQLLGHLMPHHGSAHNSILALDQYCHHNSIVAVQRRYALRTSGNVLVNRVWLQGHGPAKISCRAFDAPQFALGVCQVAS